MNSQKTIAKKFIEEINNLQHYIDKSRTFLAFTGNDLWVSFKSDLLDDVEDLSELSLDTVEMLLLSDISAEEVKEKMRVLTFMEAVLNDVIVTTASVIEDSAVELKSGTYYPWVDLLVKEDRVIGSVIEVSVKLKTFEEVSQALHEEGDDNPKYMN